MTGIMSSIPTLPTQAQSEEVSGSQEDIVSEVGVVVDILTDNILFAQVENVLTKLMASLQRGL